MYEIKKQDAWPAFKAAYDRAMARLMDLETSTHNLSAQAEWGSGEATVMALGRHRGLIQAVLEAAVELDVATVRWLGARADRGSSDSPGVPSRTSPDSPPHNSASSSPSRPTSDETASRGQGPPVSRN